MGVPVAVGVVLAWAGVFFPIESPRITSPFATPYGTFNSVGRPHLGLDVVPSGMRAEGRPVFAPIDALVHRSMFSATAGKVLVLEAVAPYTFWARDLKGNVHTIHSGQVFYFRFTHLATRFAREGDFVRGGDVIATIGRTGSSVTGPHLHIEMRVFPYGNSPFLNPLDFFIAAIPELRPYLNRHGGRW